jgi:hypothetical protein
MRSLRLLAAGALVLGFCLATTSTAAAAPLQNGDFEAGGTGWATSAPANWTVSFLAAGGNPNGYAQIMSPFGTSEGIACIGQGFDCGDPGTDSRCQISFDFRLDQVDASTATAQVIAEIDGEVVYLSPLGGSIGWTHIAFEVPCGQHRIELCLQVAPGNNGWRASFDNVKAECMTVTPVLPQSWGALKVIYR